MHSPADAEPYVCCFKCTDFALQRTISYNLSVLENNSLWTGGCTCSGTHFTTDGTWRLLFIVLNNTRVSQEGLQPHPYSLCQNPTTISALIGCMRQHRSPMVCVDSGCDVASVLLLIWENHGWMMMNMMLSLLLLDVAVIASVCEGCCADCLDVCVCYCVWVCLDMSAVSRQAD